MVGDKIPETLKQGCLCNERGTGISDHDYASILEKPRLQHPGLNSRESSIG
jgi:hypothetical protein